MTDGSGAANDPIRHVVVLILENHSFDQMLGCFREVYPDLDGIDPAHPRTNRDDAGRVYAQAPTTERQMTLDPRHEVEHVALQLADGNGGFVRDFAESYPASTPAARAFIMGHYPRGFLPALHALAAEFTVCDRWHSSLPGPTWPNRFFALSGTSLGRTDMPDDGTHRLDLPRLFRANPDDAVRSPQRARHSVESLFPRRSPNDVLRPSARASERRALFLHRRVLRRRARAGGRLSRLLADRAELHGLGRERRPSAS